MKRNADRDAAALSDPMARTVLNSLSAHIAILDQDGVILESNQAWQNFAANNGMQENSDAKGIYYLTGLLIIAALSLFLITAAAGRVWCGYTCPQTVWTDL